MGEVDAMVASVAMGPSKALRRTAESPANETAVRKQPTKSTSDALAPMRATPPSMPLRIAGSRRERLVGLLHATHEAGLLMLCPCRDIHTVGMSYSIDVAFVDEEGTVVAAYRSVPPGRRLRCRRAIAVFERLTCGKPWYEKGDRVFVCPSSPASPGDFSMRTRPAAMPEARHTQPEEEKTSPGCLPGTAAHRRLVVKGGFVSPSSGTRRQRWRKGPSACKSPNAVSLAPSPVPGHARVSKCARTQKRAYLPTLERSDHR